MSNSIACLWLSDHGYVGFFQTVLNWTISTTESRNLICHIKKHFGFIPTKETKCLIIVSTCDVNADLNVTWQLFFFNPFPPKCIVIGGLCCHDYLNTLHMLLLDHFSNYENQVTHTKLCIVVIITVIGFSPGGFGGSI